MVSQNIIFTFMYYFHILKSLQNYFCFWIGKTIQVTTVQLIRAFHHRPRHELQNNDMIYELNVSENIDSDSFDRQEAMYAFIKQATKEALSITTMEVIKVNLLKTLKNSRKQHTDKKKTIVLAM